MKKSLIYVFATMLFLLLIGNVGAVFIPGDDIADPIPVTVMVPADDIADPIPVAIFVPANEHATRAPVIIYIPRP